jgi:uncharacterized protein YggE
MKYLVAFLVLALGSVSAAGAQTTALAGPFAPTLTVQGQGVVERSPDIARLSLQIVTDDAAATASTSKNNAIFNALKSRLAGMGLSAETIHTVGFDVSFFPQPPANTPANERRDRYGYVTTRSLRVDIAPLELVGKAIDGATAAGVTDIGGVSYDLKDRHAAFLAALGVAMADAKQSAQALATAGGFTLGGFRSIQAGSNDVVRPSPQPMMMKAALAASVPTEISPGGPIEIRASVTVGYAIR